MICRLRDIDWEAALAAVDSGGPRVSRHVRAAVLGLSARFTPDYHTGLTRIRRAVRDEPFNPAHAVREALFLMRFGRWRDAARLLERMRQTAPASATVQYARALAELRLKAIQRAKNITRDLADSNPGFAPAKFLNAEARLQMGASLERVAGELPVGAEHAPLWADLLVKFVLNGSSTASTKAVTTQLARKNVFAGSPACATVVQRAIDWATMPLDQLQAAITGTAHGSRTEQLILVVFAKRCASAGGLEPCRRLSALAGLMPDRPAIRRVYAAALARAAIDHAARGQYREATRFVEACLRTEPDERTHYQNRAALATLLRESALYHDAWTALQRHDARLALLGFLTPDAADIAAAAHRLFATDARGVKERATCQVPTGRGLFRIDPESQVDKNPRWLVAGDSIKNQVDLLRQWIHHRSAALVLQHLALVRDPARMLLEPQDDRTATRRVEALSMLARSFSVLLGEEGDLLRQALDGVWSAALGRVHVRYRQEELDPKVARLSHDYLEITGDLMILCHGWAPEHNAVPACEELLAFVTAISAFFDECALFGLLQERDREMTYPMGLLWNELRTEAGLERPEGRVDPQVRAALFDGMKSALLVRMAWAMLDLPEDDTRRAERGLEYVERARALAPSDAHVELAAAQLLAVGEFFEEARAALGRLHRLLEPDQDRLRDAAERVQDAIDRSVQSGKKGRERGGGAPTPSVSASDDRVIALQEELARSPSSVRTYQDLVHELRSQGRFKEAVGWTDYAVTHCLTRRGQIAARALQIESIGLDILSQREQSAAAMYELGGRRSAGAMLASLAARETLSYPLLYLLGQCRLATDGPAAAAETFRVALAVCSRPLHMAVLRRLATDPDTAFLELVREEIDTKLSAGGSSEALDLVLNAMRQVADPAALLIDAARTCLSGAAAFLEGQSETVAPRVPQLDVPWGARFEAALASSTDLERAAAVAELARDVRPTEGPRADELLRRIGTLEEHRLAAALLRNAGEKLANRDFEEVLAMLDRSGGIGRQEPRLLRLRLLALLALERFDEAEADFVLLKGCDVGELAAFIEHFATLSVQRRLAAARHHLANARTEAADAALGKAAGTHEDERRELAYCRAFIAGLRGYAARREGRTAMARREFLGAADVLGDFLAAARDGGHQHVIELYERIERELD